MKTKISPYNQSLTKRYLNLIVGLIVLILNAPIILFIYLISKFTNNLNPIFTQKRVGQNGKIFNMIKFRTMVINAEKLQKKYSHLNIADGPVFKIHNDPRLTKFGSILVKTGLDELPQLINILKGEMNMVGPRPLPTYEANKLSKSQKYRELVKPGITSSWVISGAHNLKFKEWMRLDKEYVENATLLTDIKVSIQTIILILKLFIQKLQSLIPTNKEK